MNARIQVFSWTLLFAIFTGCGEQAEREPGEAYAAGEIQLFDKNKGVGLPPELQRELGLATVEVMEKSVTSRLEKMAQVYRAATGASPAAAVVWLSVAEAKDLRVGQGVLMGSIGSPKTSATGRLVRLEKSSSLSPGQLEALIEVDDAEGRFPMGSSLLVVFSAEGARTALVVPESAIVPGAAGAFVYTVNGEHFIRTLVKLGVAAHGGVEVTDGLYAGDVIVAKAVDSLWLIELCALKGGTPCCPVPTKKHDH